MSLVSFGKASARHSKASARLLCRKHLWFTADVGKQLGVALQRCCVDSRLLV